MQFGRAAKFSALYRYFFHLAAGQFSNMQS